MPENDKIEVIRCGKCSKRLFDGYIVNGLVNIKCKCGELNIFEGKQERKRFIITR